MLASSWYSYQVIRLWGVVTIMQLVAASQLRLVSTLTANIFLRLAEPKHNQELILLDREMTQE